MHFAHATLLLIAETEAPTQIRKAGHSGLGMNEEFSSRFSVTLRSN